MSGTNMSVGELVDKITRNEIILPEFQRRYVWTKTKVRDLLDSLYRDYPTGSILVWEYRGADNMYSRHLDVDMDQSKSLFSTSLMLLDGQQRLTSLAAIMKGEPVEVKGSKRPIEIMFNLEHPDSVKHEDTDDADNGEDDEGELEQEEDGVEEDAFNLQKFTFVVYSKALEKKKEWVKVSDIFNKSGSQILRDKGLKSEDDCWDKYMERIEKVQQIKRYPYTVNVLSEKYDYSEVTEIFVRVNSSGAKLKSSDLALAQIALKWKGCSRIFEDFLGDKKEEGFELTMQSLVRMLVVYATGQCKFGTVSSLSLNSIKEAWKQAQQGINYSLNFLRNNTLIEDLRLLSSPLIIVPIAYFSSLKKERLNSQEEKDLTRWIYLANAFGNYSVSSETTLNSELKILKENGSIKELFALIERKNGRLQIDADALKGKKKNSAFFAMAYMATKNNNAKDWFTGIGVSKGTKGKFNRIQTHHIFPKKILKGENYPSAEINEIANLSFISEKTNKEISSKKPEDYFRGIIEERGKDTLKDQFIPLDKNLWKVENYKDFLAARRERIAAAINSLLSPR